MKTFIILVVLVALLGFTGWMLRSHFDPAATPQQASQRMPIKLVTKHEVPRKVQGIGYVEPVSEVRRLAFKVGGIIAECRVQVGDRTRKGDILAALTNSNELQAIDVVRQELEVAKADEARVLRGVNRHRIEVAQRKVDAVKARIGFLQREVNRMRALQATISASELERTDSSLNEAIADQHAAEAEVAHLTNFVLDEDKHLAAARVKLLEAKVKQLEELLENTLLRAPFDGRVFELLRREGEGVTLEGREPALLFADDARLRVRAEIDERYVHLLREGLPAIAYGRNLGDVEFPGRIATIKQVMGDKTVFSRASTERKDLDTVQVLIDMDDSFRFPVGLRVDIAIEVEVDSQVTR